MRKITINENIRDKLSQCISWQINYLNLHLPVLIQCSNDFTRGPSLFDPANTFERFRHQIAPTGNVASHKMAAAVYLQAHSEVPFATVNASVIAISFKICLASQIPNHCSEVLLGKSPTWPYPLSKKFHQERLGGSHCAHKHPTGTSLVAITRDGHKPAPK